MAIRGWWRAAACSVFVAMAAAAAAAPVEVYGRLPTLEDVKLSPDGSRVVFVRTDGESRYLAVVSLADRKQIGLANVGNAKLRSVVWADNDHLLFTVSTTTVIASVMSSRLELRQLLIYDIPKQRVRNPLDQGSGMTRQRDSQTANFIYSGPMVRRVGDEVRVYVESLSSATNGYVPVTLEIDPEAASVRRVRQAARTLYDWLVDDHGEIAVEEHFHDRENEQRYSFRVHLGDQMVETVAGHESIDVPYMEGFSPDGGAVWVRRVEDGVVVRRPLSLKDGKLGQSMDDAGGFRGMMTERGTGRVVGGTRNDEAGSFVFLDPVRQARWHDIVRAFPGELVTLVSVADDYSRLIVELMGARDRLMYMLVDLNTGHATPLGQIYAGLDVVAEQRSIHYPAADGLQMQAYLTLPPGKAERALPLIVLPHGGPAAYDEPGFDWWAQALAAQGYAVLQPNYRGSNTDRELLSAGFGEWGRKMQSDLSDGVRFLAAGGVVDPKRVCIVGGSYGGYAALAGVSIEQGIYRCAVSVAGIADLRSLYADDVGGVNRELDAEQRFWNRYLGVSGPGDPKLDALSPIRHVDAISAPILLIHGRDDTVVRFSQSQVMFAALRRAGKPVELVDLKGEDHYMSRAATRLQMLQAMVGFLKTHNPPD